MKISVAKKTSLYNRHIEKNGNMVSFGGYLLPTYYTSIIKEHIAVRKNAGLFDVSHMGEFIISGNDSSTFIQKMTVNDVSSLSPGQAQYSAMCYENGGIIDDILIFKREKSYLLVVNATNIGKDLNWLNSHINGQVSINNISEEIELIALQGPKAREILQPLIDIDLMNLSYFHFLDGNIIGHKAMISQTGYTGELGYEIYIDPKYVINIWDAILEYGHKYGIEPAGLGCRDTLRMEMKYVLYGVDIDKNTNPIEADLGWVVKFNKGEFLGKKALLDAKKNLLRKFVCIEMIEQAIPRHGCRILVDNEVVGYITSGTMSPSLQIGMGMGYIDMPFSKKGTLVKIDIRGKEVPAIVIKGPFYKEGSLFS